MHRRQFIGFFGGGSLFAVATLSLGCFARDDGNQSNQKHSGKSTASQAAATGSLDLSKAQWQGRLSAERFHILFEEGTEPPGSSPLNAEKRAGTFICAACNNPLFSSTTKYESGTGWPSFWQPLEGKVETKKDFKLVWPRTEYHCARCGGHQGHVFEDGPQPTGLRYCNNGLALHFVPKGETLPELVQ